MKQYFSASDMMGNAVGDAIGTITYLDAFYGYDEKEITDEMATRIEELQMPFYEKLAGMMNEYLEAVGEILGRKPYSDEE